MTFRVLEREAELAALSDAARRAATGHGSVALLSGEAGIGKSALLDALHAELPPDGRFLVGTCDDLGTPRLLGPFRDLAGSVGAELSRALRGDARDELYAALRRELDWAGHVTVLAIEDVHWADEATLDVLRFLVRRITDLPVLLVLSWRDDEVDSGHPLRPLLAVAAAGPDVLRLTPAPLSADAVREMGSATSADPDRVLALTGGIPFLVQEVLASGGGDGVPTSVVDIVLARLHQLEPTARDAVEQLSVITSAVDRALVDALVPGGLTTLTGPEERGLLTVTPHRVAFRHELTRRAVVDALPGTRRTALNAAALAALESSGRADPAQLVHHAAAAGDVAATVRHAPRAARSAAAGGAHREAAAHYRLALEHRDAFTTAELADLLEASAIECYTVGDHERTSMPDQAEVVALRRELGDPVALGSSLRWLSRISWWCGDRAAAEMAGEDAIHVLLATGSKRELALAWSNASQLAMLAEQTGPATAAAQRAIDLARELDEPSVLSHALNNLGTARWAAGDPAGRAILEEALQVALDADLSDDASRAYCNLVWQLLGRLELDEAGRRVEAGIGYAERSERVVFWKYLHVERGMIALAGARWDDADTDARVGLDATSPIRCSALYVQGRSALRTGRDADHLVAECWALGLALDELQRSAPAAGLVCEAAWLRGDLATVAAVAGPVYDEATRLESPAWRVEAGFWLSTTGASVDLDPDTHPYAALAMGDWRSAADTWERAGCPYEAALALSLSGEPDTLLDALSRLDALGAVPLADRVRERLREDGVAGVPRGPSRSTRDNPAGLTGRQLDVLTLLAGDLSNAAIAERLVLSVRTVDHHVAAVLQKLGVASRTEAVAAARGHGWVGPG